MPTLSLVADVNAVLAKAAPAGLGEKHEHRDGRELHALITGYRTHGNRAASVNPLDIRPTNPSAIAELDPATYGLPRDDGPIYSIDLGGLPQTVPVASVVAQLQASYCGPVTVSCAHVRDRMQRQWLYARFERRDRSQLANPERCSSLLQQLAAAETFERYLTAQYPSHKRFSLEGSESLIPLLNTVIESSGRLGAEDAVLGMAHRGRLNVLRNVLGMPAVEMLSMFTGEPHRALAAWDLREHVGYVSSRRMAQGDVRILLAHNPSHLESVSPIVCGMARAMQERKAAGSSRQVLPLMVHGDAAFSGQGIVMETLNLSQTRGYHVGGTVHVILNNQVGSTVSDVRDLRSTLFCADAGRAIDAPILRVNGDDPDAVWFAARLAAEFRHEFAADIIVEMVAYRRYGHAGGNDAALTQPAMQRQIQRHLSVVDLYAETLAVRGLTHDGDLARFRANAVDAMVKGDAELALAARDHAVRTSDLGTTAWSGPVHTGVPTGRLQALLARLATVAPGFTVHEDVRKAVNGWRAAAVDDTSPVDWRLAENLAYASLLANGFNVRVSGLDVGRGSFFHRLAVWHDQEAGVDGEATHVPLRGVADAQGQFSIVDSPLSEAAVLGFEYGYSLYCGRDLVVWEAQLGDFVNNAQVIIDQYVTTGEAKWGYKAGLVVMLPHGHEGAGPEHSSAFIGRFLQLCGDDNIRVAMPSTPAQLFHLLRRQTLVDTRKPLVVMTPKSWLYNHAPSYSRLRDLAADGFRVVVGEYANIDVAKVVRVVVTGGKLFYDLTRGRGDAQLRNVPIVRVEQLYPFPVDDLAEELARWPHLREVVWAQEEAKNHGAWYLLRDHLQAALPSNVSLVYAGRPVAAPSAVCHAATHAAEQRDVVRAALGLA